MERNEICGEAPGTSNRCHYVPMAPNRNRRALRQQADGDTVSAQFLSVELSLVLQPGLLMSAVRALVTSATEDQRELEKERLLISHTETAAVIHGLVAQNQSELQV